MPHMVICAYCGEHFDRDKIAFVQSSSRRYGHASCYLRAKESKKESRDLQIIDPDNIVLCFCCKKPINKTTDEYKIINSKYMHLPCAEIEEKREKTPAEQLDIYICQLFGLEYVSPNIKKQITYFINKYNYTHTGILKALKFFYEIKHNDINKANGHIGIVPYVYNDAYNYYYSLWLADQKNNTKDIQKYVPKTIEVVIPPPERRGTKKKLFTFLDKDEIEDGE